MGGLKIYKSSAGSGKTFTLATQYLILALRHPSYFKHILAVTFTNKATAEMKERVIHFLHLFSKGNTADPFHFIKDTLGIEEDELIARSEECLHQILHGYHQFSIQTIDSFFQKVVRAFAREMGLPGGYQVQLDVNSIKEQLVDELLMEIGTNKTLSKWLLQFSKESLQEGKWDVRRDIKELATLIFKEEFLGIAHQLPKLDSDFEQLTDTIKSIQTIKSGFENHLKKENSAVKQLIQNHHLTIDDFYYGKAGVLSIINKIDKDDFSGGNTRLNDVLNGNKQWYGGKVDTATKNAIDAALAEGLGTMLQKIVEYIDENTIRYNTAKQALSNFYTLALLAYIKQKSRELQNQEEYLTNQDIAEFLNGLISQNDSPFIYEKIGNRYHHYLLDEFQDTSGMQWDNIRPLVQNSLAEGNANLIVGDVKQSIYRWRAGDLNLLLEQVQADIGKAFVEEQNLDSNFRSKKNVIDFNNHLFRYAPTMIEEHLVEDVINQSSLSDSEKHEFASGVHKINLAYQGVQQKQGREFDRHGYVSVKMFDSQEEEYETQLIANVDQQLAQLFSQGVAARDIGILVRNNRDGGTFINAYYEHGLHEKYAAIVSSESLFLKNSDAIQLLLHAMRWLEDHQNQVALAQAAYFYLKLNKRADEWQTCNCLADFQKILPAALTEQAKVLSKMELSVLLDRLISVFSLAESSLQYPYLTAFQTWVLDFMQKEKGDLSALNSWWKEEDNNPSMEVPGGLDALQLLTIHKSKGLQFKVVIIPYFHWDLDVSSKSGFTKQLIWANSAEPPFDQIPWYVLPYSKALENTFFSKYYYEERIKQSLDNLNLMYVALTRAEDALFCYSKYNKQLKADFNKVHAFFCQLVQQHAFSEGNWNQDQMHFELGKINEISPSTARARKEEVIRLASFTATDWQGKLTIRKPRWRNLESEAKLKVDFGVQVHELLSRIYHKNQADAALQNMLLEGMIDAAQAEAIKEIVAGIFEMPAVKAWFSSDGIIRNEAAILLPNGRERRIDRLMIKDKACTVIDYKTGQKEEKHHKQVQEYMAVIKQMGFEEVKGYLLYLDEKAVEEVA